MNLFTGTSWGEFLQAGGNVTGFKEGRWTTAKRIKVGDYLLCYVTGISRFIGVLEVISEAYEDFDNKIWEFDMLPSRLEVKPLVILEPETAIPFSNIKNNLVMYQQLKNPKAWGNLVKGSPRKLEQKDGEFIVKAILDSKANPNPIDYDKKMFNIKPRHYLKSKKRDY